MPTLPCLENIIDPYLAACDTKILVKSSRTIPESDKARRFQSGFVYDFDRRTSERSTSVHEDESNVRSYNQRVK